MAEVFQTFEHDRLVVGRRYSGVTFTRRLQTALSTLNDRHDGRFFKVGHRAIEFRQYVGVVCVGNSLIEILPKADRDRAGPGDAARWRDALVQMLRVARGLQLHAPTRGNLRLRDSTLLDLLVAEFLTELEALLHAGLKKKYGEAEGNLNYFTGRLIFPRQMVENAVHKERSYVAHCTYDHDHLLNQILRRALTILLDLDACPSLRGWMEALDLRMPRISDRQIREEHFARVRLDRTTEQYRRLLEVARLIILHLTPDFRGGTAPCLAILFDMNSLFEQFVAAIARRLRLTTHVVRAQSSAPFWPDSRHGLVGTKTLRPDLLSRAPMEDRTKTLDTKWKLPADSTPDAADLKQLFAYNEIFGATESILLYPKTGRSPQPIKCLKFRKHDHSCSTAFLELFDEDGRLSVPIVAKQLEALIRS